MICAAAALFLVNRKGVRITRSRLIGIFWDIAQYDSLAIAGDMTLPESWPRMLA